MTETLCVRDCTIDDISVVQAIYAHYVLNGVASFEEIPPDPPEIQRRWEMIVGLGLPFLIAAIDGVVGGYAYAGTYRSRSAYRYTVEDAVYVDAVKAGKGLGRALLSGLITRCSEGGYRQMIAVIGDSGNDASIGLHAALGFERVAFLLSIGFKHGRWVDTVYMQRPLGLGDSQAPE